MDDRFKFRAWDTRAGGWRHSVALLPEGFLVWQDGTDMDDAGLVVEKCTGLKNKSGKKLIYEGDICKTPCSERVKYIVRWDIDRTGFILQQIEIPEDIIPLKNRDDLIIIGNIHETPELLECAG